MKRPPLLQFLVLLFIAVFAVSVSTQAYAQHSGADAPIEKTAFVSPETVAVGCGAGLTAGVFSAWLPMIAPLPGQSTLVTLPILTAWGLIGCTVGVAAGLSAVIAQAGLNALN